MNRSASIRRRLRITTKRLRKCGNRRTYTAPALWPRISWATPRGPSRIERRPTTSNLSTNRDSQRRNTVTVPMFSVRIEVEPERADELLADLWEAGTLGVIEGDAYVEAFFEDAERAQ